MLISFPVHASELPIPKIPVTPTVLTEKGKIVQIIQSYDWDASQAVKIAACESRFNPAEHNYNPKTGDDSYSIFQINRYGDLKKTRPTPEELMDVSFNINYAYNLWKSEKVKWSDWKNCAEQNGLL